MGGAAAQIGSGLAKEEGHKPKDEKGSQQDGKGHVGSDSGPPGNSARLMEIQGGHGSP